MGRDIAFTTVTGAREKTRKLWVHSLHSLVMSCHPCPTSLCTAHFTLLCGSCKIRSLSLEEPLDWGWWPCYEELHHKQLSHLPSFPRECWPYQTHLIPRTPHCSFQFWQWRCGSCPDGRLTANLQHSGQTWPWAVPESKWTHSSAATSGLIKGWLGVFEEERTEISECKWCHLTL